MQNPRKLPLVCLLAAVLLTYANSFGNTFHFDDFHTVTDNPAVRSLRNLPRIFTDTTAFSVLPANQTFRPIVTASLAFDYALGRGYTPLWFHLSTMVWFLALVGLLYAWAGLIYRRTEARSGSAWAAFLVAAWFGLHPAMAETVNYVIQRGDLYCTLGCVASSVLFARYPSWRRYGLYLLPFALAMLAKPPALVFPLLLLLYVFFFEANESSARQRWRMSLTAAAPSLAIAGLLLWLQSVMTPKSYTPTILSSAAYRLTQPYVWMRYVTTLALPLHLNVDTDLQPFATLTVAAGAGMVFVAGLTAITAYCACRRRMYPIAYGLMWFALTQLPTSLYALSEVENDHRMFFSFPGLMLATVWAFYLAYQRVAARMANKEASATMLPRLAAGLCGLLLCAYAYGTHRRNAVWHDEASLWADDVAKSPHNGRGLMIYGLTRMNAGDLTGALALFNSALLFTPNYPTLEINLGIVNGLLADGGQGDRSRVAEDHFMRAILLGPNDDLTHAYYGRWLLHHGRLPEATAQLEAAIGLNGQRVMQRDLLMEAYSQAGNTGAAQVLARTTLAFVPGDAAASAVAYGTPTPNRSPQVAALINASLAAYQAGQFQRSIEEAQAALKLDPQSAEAWNNIGAGYGALHQWGAGVAAEQEALKLNPKLTIASNNLHWFVSQETGVKPEAVQNKAEPGPNAAAYVNDSLALNRAGKYVESIQQARKALKLDPTSVEAWNNVAAGDEAIGHWDEAIDAARHALVLRPDFQLARNNLAWSLQQKAVGKH